MWTKNPALLAVKRSRTPEYHWWSVAPLPYHNPRKKKSKRKSYCYLRTPVFPVKNTFLRMYAARSFFCVLFGMSPFYTTWADGTRFTPPRHSGAVDAWWPRGRGGGSPICQVGARKGRQNGTKKIAKKSEKKNVRASTSLSARVLLFFFFVMFFRPSPPLPLGTAWSRCAEMPLRSVSAELLQRERSFYHPAGFAAKRSNHPPPLSPSPPRSAR